MFQIVLTSGGTPTEFTQARAERYRRCVVSEIDDDGKFVRVVDKTEYTTWGDTPPVAKKAVATKAVTEKKPAKKKKVNKQKKTAIPDEDTSLENIDVSSL